MKAFVIDVGRCNGCFGCQFVCKDEHVGNDWAPIARPQPDTGQFWMRLDEHICGSVPKVRMHYVPNPCMHCDEAACMAVCKVEGAIYKRDDGMVVIDSDLCTGCKACLDACPYDSIYFNDDLNLAQKCTGCAHLLDGGWDHPRCVDSCPTGAIKFAEESELAELIAGAEVLKPEAGTKPRVYYRGIPRQFIGGTVYDPVEKEVVVGATVTATAADGAACSVTTDAFGDFWLEDLPAGVFNVSIEADGFKPAACEVDTAESVNLGDIALEK
jgi:Fe-S-cluster-containing dehydrogenase component